MLTKEGERAIDFVRDIENISTRYGLKRTDAIELFKMITLSNLCQEIKDVADVIDVGFQRIADKMAEQ